MPREITPTPLAGVFVLTPEVFTDERGFFCELYHQEKYAALELPGPFVQDNHSFSKYGVLRGLHYQQPRAQAKLVTVVAGEIFDVAADIRQGSPTFGRWFGVRLSGENHRQMYVPAGLAHGFCVLSETAQVIYKCTDFYAPAADRGVLWCDGDLGIDWPIDQPVLSAKDQARPRLREIPPGELPTYP